MTTTAWEGRASLDQVTRLVESQAGRLRTVETVTARPWSTVWRAETDTGVWFAKENCPEQSHEPDLLTAIEQVAPGRVVPVTAADGALFVMPDLGPPLGSQVADVETWCRVVVAAAELQRETASAVGSWSLVSLPPEEAVLWVRERVTRFSSYAVDDARHLGREDAERVLGALPAVAVWAEQVGALNLPSVLVHNDLHAGNVFDLDGSIRLFDFGDAVTMEPLAGLLIPINVLAHGLDAGPDDPRLWRVANAALEVWSDMVPLSELRRALPAALQLGRLGRVESWERIARSMDPTGLAEYGGSAASWLATLAEDPPLGHVSRP